MDMIQSRNLPSLAYNEATAREIGNAVIEHFHPAFARLLELLRERREGESR